jgi:hypothetical protein
VEADRDTGSLGAIRLSKVDDAPETANESVCDRNDGEGILNEIGSADLDHLRC